MLAKPFSARCDDRSALPKQHPTSGAPEDWFDNALLATVGLKGIAFDFFINWVIDPPVVTPVIGIKRLLKPEFSYAAFMENLDQAIIAEFGLEYLAALSAFAAKYNLAVQLVVFKDEQNWNDDASEICMVNVNNGPIFIAEVITLTQFKALIQANSGGPVIVGAKGLIYGTSRLECALSHTNAAYPGDMDLLVLNDQYDPVLFMEFKKDSLGGPISDQKLSRYYPYPDARKYNRLAIFRNFLQNEGQHIPFAVVYYPTTAAITQIKIELIKGEPNALVTAASQVFNKNQTGDHTGSAPLVKAIVDKHYTL